MRLAGMTGLLAASDLLENAATIVVVGPRRDPRAPALLAAALASPDPATCVLRGEVAADLPSSHPAFGKGAPDGVPAAYLCRAGTCSLPVTDPDALRRLMVRH